MKNAFTMMELIFVIIVIGILSATMLPHFQDTSLRQAAQQVLSDIRYTQHLAMVSDKYDANDTNWYKKRWQIMFGSTNFSNHQISETIFSDFLGSSTGNPNESEIAISPLNPAQRMTGGYGSGSPVVLDINHANFVGIHAMNLGETYGITDLTFSSSCTISGSKRIAFDYIGRPLFGSLRTSTRPYQKERILKEICRITLIKGEDNISIEIYPESGFAEIIN